MLKERYRSFSGLLGAATFIFVFVSAVNLFNLEQTLFLNRVPVLGGQVAVEVLAKENLNFPEPSFAFGSNLSLKNSAVLGFSAPVLLTSASSSEEFSRGQSNTVFTYVIQENDTLSSLAQKFNIDVNTIVWANNLSSTELKPGDYLVILPVSGVLYEVSSTDSLDSIAQSYGVAKERIAVMNSLLPGEAVMPGEKLIVPGGTQKQKLSLVNPAAAKTGAYFKMPTTGWSWGKLHPDNAVDIVNSCGTPVYASASGFVKDARNDDTSFPSSSDGNFVLISHKNNIETFYGRLSTVFVSPGAYVNQGDLIGATGNTGKTEGHVGCHLHFEVHGAANPFVK